MKKFLVVIMILCCLFSCGYAENTSISSNNSLYEVSYVSEEKVLVWENEHIRLWYLETNIDPIFALYNSNFFIEKLSNCSLMLSCNNVSVNSNPVTAVGLSIMWDNDTEAKYQIGIWDSLEVYSIKTVSDITDITFTLCLQDGNEKILATSDPITLNFSN